MSKSRLRNPYVSTAIYLLLTLLIGAFVVVLPLNGLECNIVLNVQIYAQKTVGLQFFQVVTYLGDFYLWVIVGSVYLIYAYFKSRKSLDSAVELAVFLVVTTALTSFLKVVFTRPRPDCPGLSVYQEDVISSFSYPSGHVSRSAGAFLILSRGNRTKEVLGTVAVFLISLSRIVLGAHYLTDVIGGIFLSLAAQKIANLVFVRLGSGCKSTKVRVRVPRVVRSEIMVGTDLTHAPANL
jgi:membrane-associated phospholipid phosphatase